MKTDNSAKNVLGTELEECCSNPLTGYFRDGFCHTDYTDLGKHTVCVKVTAAFLAFSKIRGNDLTTPHPEFNFPGLKPGDCWCLCASRWKEAYEANAAPLVKLRSTHIATLDIIPLETLKQFALDLH